jgi:hypothetical protein
MGPRDGVRARSNLVRHAMVGADRVSHRVWLSCWPLPAISEAHRLSLAIWLAPAFLGRRDCDHALGGLWGGRVRGSGR